jgi:hypothetical protein
MFRTPTFTLLNMAAISYSRPDSNSIAVNLELHVLVDNPNLTGAYTTEAWAFGQSPSLPGVDIAQGHVKDLVLPARQQTNVSFPLTVTYSSRVDKNQAALKDVITRCGLSGQPKQPIPFLYRADAKVATSLISFSAPEFAGSSQFDCPLPANFTSMFASNWTAPVLTGLVGLILGS